MSDHIFTASDYWRGMRVIDELEPVGDHARTLFAHGPHKDHCKGWEVHAWPCFPAEVVLSDLREFIGRDAWAALDPFCRASEGAREECERMSDALPHIACPCGRAPGKPSTLTITSADENPSIPPGSTGGA